MIRGRPSSSASGRRPARAGAGCRGSRRSCGRGAPGGRTATGSRRCRGSRDRCAAGSHRRRRWRTSPRCRCRRPSACASDRRGEVVLGAAVDVVEGLGVVDRDLVELGGRQVAVETPGGAAVPGLVETAVTAGEQVIGVVRVDPQGVVVNVFVGLGHVVEGLAAVLGDLHPGVHRVDGVGVVGIDDQLLVVLGTAADVTATFLQLAPRSVER